MGGSGSRLCTHLWPPDAGIRLLYGDIGLEARDARHSRLQQWQDLGRARSFAQFRSGASGALYRSSQIARSRLACAAVLDPAGQLLRSEKHTSELQSLMRISYAVFCLQKKNNNK